MPAVNPAPTILAVAEPYESARIVLFGAPYDGTTSYRPGTRFGSSAIRRESYGLESYSPYQHSDLEGAPVHDMGDLDLPFGGPEKPLAMIREAAAEIFADSKIPLMLGGEHLVTLGAVEAAYACWPDLCILHFDAHTDLREEYIGQRMSHASVMRRCHDLLGDGRIYQLGVRSGTREEFDFAADGHVWQRPFDLAALPEAIAALGSRPIYLTIDLDILDPSVFPGTGTPEPGGLGFVDLIKAVGSLKGLRVVGADLVELSPMYDPSGISVMAAAKVLRELLLVLLAG
jgi:agmatinase